MRAQRKSGRKRSFEIGISCQYEPRNKDSYEWYFGFTELLKAPELTGEKQQRFINIIEKSGARMLNIINDIISISRIESGRFNFQLHMLILTNLQKIIVDFF